MKDNPMSFLSDFQTIASKDMSEIVNYIKQAKAQGEHSKSYKDLKKEMFEIIQSACQASGTSAEDVLRLSVFNGTDFRLDETEEILSEDMEKKKSSDKGADYREDRASIPSPDDGSTTPITVEGTEEIIRIHKIFQHMCQNALSSCETSDSIVFELMDNINEVMQSQYVKIFLLDMNDEFSWPPEQCDVYESHDHSSKYFKGKNKRKIEFDSEVEIAWYTVNENLLINLTDPASDPRFKRNVDLQYGFAVRNMISFPIEGSDTAIGVVNVINKINEPCFSSFDEYKCRIMGKYISFITKCNEMTHKAKKLKLELKEIQETRHAHSQIKAEEESSNKTEHYL